jgi:3-hydroxyisobutyrate dehydrogenase
MMQEKKTVVGFVGTGVMGFSMAKHLALAGFEVKATNRSLEKAQGLRAFGVRVLPDLEEVVSGSDILCTMLGYPRDVEQVYMEGVFPYLQRQPSRPSLLIDFTTTQPSLSVEIARIAAELGVFALDAPVSGGDVGAREGTLSIMVGGEAEAFDRALPVFQVVGRNVRHQGGPGAGQHTKMTNQITIAGTMMGVCEALVYGHTMGLDLTQVLESISKGAAGCWTLDHLAPRMLKGDFEPGFFVSHFLKDLRIALEEARRVGLELQGLALAHDRYQETVARGWGQKGTQVLLKTLSPSTKTKEQL